MSLAKIKQLLSEEIAARTKDPKRVKAIEDVKRLTSSVQAAKGEKDKAAPRAALNKAVKKYADQFMVKEATVRSWGQTGGGGFLPAPVKTPGRAAQRRRHLNPSRDSSVAEHVKNLLNARKDTTAHSNAMDRASADNSLTKDDWGRIANHYLQGRTDGEENRHKFKTVKEAKQAIDRAHWRSIGTERRLKQSGDLF